MRLLLVDNPAGISTELKKCLPLKCTVVAPKQKFKYEIDKELPKNKILWRILIPFEILKHDIIHFNSLLFPYFPIDLLIWKLLGKTIIVHRHGTEIRGKTEHWLVESFADRIYVSTPDLLEFTKKAEWLPFPVNLADFEYSPGGSGMLHMPSDRKKKGTDIIMQKFPEARLIENKPHHEALEEIKRCESLVDNATIGWYGVTSLEAMAMGKRVFCYVKPDLRAKFKPKVIWDDAKESLAYTGKDAREYVERVHDNRKVVEQYMRGLDGIKIEI